MQNWKLRQRVISIYIAVTILWIPFLLYLGLHETISVQNFRTQSTAIDIPQVSSRKIVDSTAPIGIRAEYCWTLQKVSSSDSVLAFYLAHHNAEVYLDHTLVYHLASSDTNRISKTPGSSWVCIPLRPSDSGKTVRVVVTPLFQRVRNQALSFAFYLLQSNIFNNGALPFLRYFYAYARAQHGSLHGEFAGIIKFIRYPYAVFPLCRLRHIYDHAVILRLLPPEQIKHAVSVFCKTVARPYRFVRRDLRKRIKISQPVIAQVLYLRHRFFRNIGVILLPPIIKLTAGAAGAAAAAFVSARISFNGYFPLYSLLYAIAK